MNMNKRTKLKHNLQKNSGSLYIDFLEIFTAQKSSIGSKLSYDLTVMLLQQSTNTCSLYTHVTPIFQCIGPC